MGKQLSVALPPSVGWLARWSLIVIKYAGPWSQLHYYTNSPASVLCWTTHCSYHLRHDTSVNIDNYLQYTCRAVSVHYNWHDHLCPQPLNSPPHMLTIIGVTGSTVELNWLHPNGAILYEIEYKQPLLHSDTAKWAPDVQCPSDHCQQSRASKKQ